MSGNIAIQTWAAFMQHQDQLSMREPYPRTRLLTRAFYSAGMTLSRHSMGVWNRCADSRRNQQPDGEMIETVMLLNTLSV
jgi:hypothetical protein